MLIIYRCHFSVKYTDNGQYFNLPITINFDEKENKTKFPANSLLCILQYRM